MIVQHAPMTHDEWMRARKGRMTSSVVAGALGLNPHMSPLDAWLSITGRESFAGNKATLRGTVLEPVVLDYPVRKGGLKRRDAPFVLGPGGWSGDSADCLYESPKDATFVGEGKTVAQGGADQWGDEGTDDVPDQVIAQCAWHMMHWPETKGAIVPVLIGGFHFEFREYFVHRDNDLIGELAEAAQRFHRDYVVTDMPPPPRAGDDEGLKFLWPRHVPGKWMPPSEDLESLTREYIRVRSEAKAADERKSEIGARLRMLIGDHEGVRGAGWKVTWKHQAGSVKTDWEALARSLGATEEQERAYTRMSEGHRVLRATLPEKKQKGSKS